MMLQDANHILIDNMLYSCIDKVKRVNEQFVHDHSLGYIISGEVSSVTPEGIKIFKQGEIGIVRRNQLLRSVKIPPVGGGDFKAINIILTQEILRKYSAENDIHADGKYDESGFYIFPDDLFLKAYFGSLIPYFDNPGTLAPSMADIKTKEALELILRLKPSLKNLLFDFAEPHKINLEAFMEQHYTYKVSMSDFARLTGRSLASFKRDFEKIFNTSPGAWLQQKRLAEAYYLIKEKRIKPSAAYLDVGFENLSHFSFAFKKAFGVAPSLL